ncbi:biotin--[acetyl-CoA-carboxylase] ligase [Marinilabilia salmonicolor]|uniref:biotin--[acetyl-CoA-carboxylase] ligase n=1 Tax=Marinilabilia salmonicolor TaxID=989 RepID=UPI000299EDBA|nr:biotin--[acetyl-CoA-carboxylase] ligase [Marinilabilia salmonicolor]
MQHIPEIIQPAQTASTSTYLKELLKQRKLPECSVVITNNQTEGKGQPGNKWETEPGKNLTFSMIFYPNGIKASEQFIISKAVSVAIVKTLKKFNLSATIKWPNDIYINDKKLGGILIENTLSGQTIDQCIIGIGLNINQETFPDHLPNPVSAKNVSGRETDLLAIFGELHESISDLYDQVLAQDHPEIEKEYLNQLYRRSGRHLYKDKTGLFKAEFHSIGPAGHLFLKREDGSVTGYAFKEVEHIL